MFKIFDKSTQEIVKAKAKTRPTEIDKMVSKRLKNKRIMLGLFQKDVAAAADVTIQQVQKYESGVNRIAAGKLHEIAKFLKEPVEYFFNQDDTKQEIEIEIEIENEYANIVKEFVKIKNPLATRKIIKMIKLVN